MARRKTRSPADGSGSDYEVGYRRPPKHSQFQPGQSGNPAGRRKGVRNFATDVIRMLSTPVKVKENGRTRTRSTQEGALMVMREKALQRDQRAIDRLLELALRFNSAAEMAADQPLDADDRALLVDHEAEVAARLAAAPTKAPPNTGSAPTRSPRSGKKEQQ